MITLSSVSEIGANGSHSRCFYINTRLAVRRKWFGRNVIRPLTTVVTPLLLMRGYKELYGDHLNEIAPKPSFEYLVGDAPSISQQLSPYLLHYNCCHSHPLISFSYIPSYSSCCLHYFIIIRHEQRYPSEDLFSVDAIFLKKKKSAFSLSA